jgi:hypothetical protein
MDTPPIFFFFSFNSHILAILAITLIELFSIHY